MRYQACLPTCSPPMETGCERAGYRIGCINLELLSPCADSGGVVGSSLAIPQCQPGGVRGNIYTGGPNYCGGIQLRGSAEYWFGETGITADDLNGPVGLFLRCLIADDLTAYIGKMLQISIAWDWACRLDQTRFVLKVVSRSLGSGLGSTLFWGQGYVDGSVWHTAPVDVELTGLNGSRDANVRISVPSPCPVCTECDPGCYPECIKCPAAANLALVIEEDSICCLHGTFDLQYNGTDDQWQTWTPGGTIGPTDWIGGPDGVCGIIKWAIVSCGTDNSHLNLQFLYRDVNGSEFTVNYDLAASCVPVFETEYATIPSNPFAPGLCDGGFFRGSKLRIVAV